MVVSVNQMKYIPKVMREKLTIQQEMERLANYKVWLQKGEEPLQALTCYYGYLGQDFNSHDVVKQAIDFLFLHRPECQGMNFNLFVREVIKEVGVRHSPLPFDDKVIEAGGSYLTAKIIGFTPVEDFIAEISNAIDDTIASEMSITDIKIAEIITRTLSAHSSSFATDDKIIYLLVIYFISYKSLIVSPSDSSTKKKIQQGLLLGLQYKS
jgi:hypothetical protein